jgi:hypothetical protein
VRSWNPRRSGVIRLLTRNRRAKIKTLAKKSIETGEDCDAIPECMRQYLAIQAMENGKGGYGYMDRSRMSAYGNGSMLMQQEPQPQGKIGTLRIFASGSVVQDADELNSDPPFELQVAEHWILASCWTKHHGFDRLLLA